MEYATSLMNGALKDRAAPHAPLHKYAGTSSSTSENLIQTDNEKRGPDETEESEVAEDGNGGTHQ